ncbi:MAG: acyltransferase family protein [Synechococcus sp.]
MNSRDATNYLKGFAILAVVANHFTNSYVTDSMGGYANSLISIFFTLSGYGIYHSLIEQVDRPAREIFVSFMTRRLTRIYPLYWIAYLLKGSPDGILGFWALDFTDPERMWFVPAIVQCYLVAPFLFLLVKRTSYKLNIPIMLGSLLVLNMTLNGLEVAPVRTLAFQGIFFLHILQFHLGLVVAKLERYLALNKYIFGISFLLILGCVHETTPHATLHFLGSDYLFPLLLSIATVAMFASLLRSSVILPLQKTIAFIGIYSYSIYLFHGIQFRILLALGVLHKGGSHWLGILVSLLTLPFFILVYAAFETVVNELIFGNRDFRRAFGVFKQRLLPAT